MEFLDEYESKPRFLLQSKTTQSQPSDQIPSSYISSLHKPTLLISISISILILNLTFFYFNSEPLKSLFLWLSLSLLVGPFAPPSLTGGPISVGKGGPLVIEEVEPKIPFLSSGSEKQSRKSSKNVRKQPEYATGVFENPKGSNGSLVDLSEGKKCVEGVEEGEWGDVEYEMLKKLMTKHPVGKPGRWEAIAEGFNGRFKVESVIARSKEMGERKVSDQDSYKKFLKDRKAVDKRVIEEGESENGVKEESGVVWSSGEDLALLSAMKAFPKDVAMRWEKIAVAVPGKSKAACMKRVGELKKDFRSSKAT